MKTLSIGDFYDIREIIGKGLFSEVRRAVCRQTRQNVAIKSVNLNEYPQLRASVYNSISVRSNLQHPGIIELFDVFEQEGVVYMVLELFSGKDLMETIAERGKLSEKETSNILCQILLALKYVHSKGITVCNLSPETVLVSENPDSGFTIKLNDFKSAAKRRDMIFEEISPVFAAPEILIDGHCQPKSDMWAVGVIAYLMICGYPPFFRTKLKCLEKDIIAGKYEFNKPWWNCISDCSKNLIRNLLLVDVDERLSASEALDHQFINPRQSEIDLHEELRCLDQPESERSSRSFTDTLVSVASASVDVKPKIFRIFSKIKQAFIKPKAKNNKV
ncbi:hypothetical protein HK103_001244 [Boothiomyces macroporosus]|uniref:Protein kinase domain-containing protein n=1 Tax=Boothiomyces macroporosus TaxID=261099 RepID=A0AAD5Y5M9_9FUNG|nr:hypothetical protein HK103_001244 [Boothiomyces macroporosus]